MSYASKESASDLGAFSSLTFFDLTPTLLSGELAHVQVEFDFNAAVFAVIVVQTTLDDDPSPAWDTRPLAVYRVANTDDPGRMSFDVSGVYRFRVGIEGRNVFDAAASMSDASMSIRRDQVDLAS